MDSTTSSSPVDRVVEGEARSVEELAAEPEVAGDAVDAVARNGKIDRREVDADLVGPAGLEADAQERVRPQELDDVEMGHGVPRP